MSVQITKEHEGQRIRTFEGNIFFILKVFDNDFDNDYQVVGLMENPEGIKPSDFNSLYEYYDFYSYIDSIVEATDGLVEIASWTTTGKYYSHYHVVDRRDIEVLLDSTNSIQEEVTLEF